jgi:TfoX/Sxy family transcriptional regulator of competence genes
MASEQNFVTFVIGQIQNIGIITAKKMFGEFGVYCEGKLFGVICDNKLFIKITAKGREFIGNPIELSPYEGAKPSFLIEDKIEDSKWLSDLVKITLENLPEPKIKKKNK